MSAGHSISNATFHGLAFPVVRVRYAGPTDHRGSRWIARLRRDNERSYRATVGYRDGLPSGAQQAITAALECFGKALADLESDASVADYVAIPGDLSADEYSFTFVPSYIFGSKS